MVELVIVAALLILLLVMSFNFLLPAIRVSTYGFLRVGMQQEAFIALNRLYTDLQLSEPKGVTVKISSPPLVAINPFEVPPSGNVAAGNEGRITWTRRFHIWYYDATSRELRSRTWPCTPPGSSDPALPASLSTGLQSKKLPLSLVSGLVADRSVCRIQARDVQEFRIEPTSAETHLRQPLKFTVTLQREGNTGRGKPERFTFSRTVFMAGTT